jgi:general secretion pathway protein K
MTHDRCRGVILVTVLWSIALLSALAMAASLNFREFAGVMAVSRDRVQGEALLTAGLEAAAGQLADAGERVLVDAEIAFDLSTGSVRARLSDEGGRIDIGRAPIEVLASLLLSVGAPAAQADAIARGIVERRGVGSGSNDATRTDVTRGGGTRADNVRRLDDATTKRPRGELPFTDVRQLVDIPGMTSEWAAAAIPLTTVFGGETVNPLTAPAPVIAALPGVDQSRLVNFLATRRAVATDGERLGQILGAAQRYVAVRPQRVAAVEVSARLPDGYVTAARAVITLLPQDSQPYRVILWQPVPSAQLR